MRAHTEYEPVSAMVKVWLYGGGPSSAYALRHTANGWDLEAVEPGQEVEPSLTLPRDAAEALVEALTDTLPPSGQMGEHLRDAVAVRDRLLAMVEKRWDE